MARDINDREAVTAWIKKMEPEFAELIEEVRKIILSTDTIIAEQIKWNAPSFFYAGEMKPFDPKEYKRDLIVMNVRKGVVMLVFPTGAVIEDGTGLLEGSYADGRRMAYFRNIDDIHQRGRDLQHVIRQWLQRVEK